MTLANTVDQLAIKMAADRILTVGCVMLTKHVGEKKVKAHSPDSQSLSLQKIWYWRGPKMSMVRTAST